MDKFHLFPPQASTTAHQVDALYLALTLISLFFMAAVFLPILFFCIKYRGDRRPIDPIRRPART